MALQDDPPLALSEIETEFEAPVGTPLSQFLRGGPFVPESATNAGVPTALPIAMLDLLGAANEIFFPFLGLQWQADVNTRGRTDDAPYEHVGGAVGTNLSLNDAPPPTIGPPGDGGFVPMVYDFNLGSGGDGQTSSIPIPIGGFAFVGAPFTMAIRVLQPPLAAQFHGNSYWGGMGADFAASRVGGSQFSALNPGNDGDIRIEISSDNDFENVRHNAPPPVDDGVEHVIIFRTPWTLNAGDADMQGIVDTVVFETKAGQIGGSILYDRCDCSYDYINSSSPRMALASIFWMGFWDFRISDADVELLSATPNPFV